MEIEALEATLMDEFKEWIEHFQSVLPDNTISTAAPFPYVDYTAYVQQDDELDESTTTPEKCPDEPPQCKKGIQASELKFLKDKLDQEASESLGMAMVYTLVTSAKEWLSERYSQDTSNDNTGEEELEKDDLIILQGEPVTVEIFLAWRERFEVELALKRVKSMPEAALTAPKEKKMTGRQWFESGRASVKDAAIVNERSDEDNEEDVDFDNNFEDDEGDMLEHCLAEKSDL